MGLERTITVLQGKTSVYMTEIFQPVIQAIEALSGITYGNNPEKDKSIRIITDHARSSVFILRDPKGVTPSNVGAGYVCEDLYAVLSVMEKNWYRKSFLADLAESVIANFKVYPELHENAEKLKMN